MSLSNNNSPHQMKKSKFLLIRILWITLGSTFVAIGTIGIFVPGLPTTVFMILAAACYVRSSEKLYNWLIRNKTFGKYIKDYREGKGMPMRAKFCSINDDNFYILGSFSSITNISSKFMVKNTCIFFRFSRFLLCWL